jgi:hypothetical protein
VVLVVDSVGVVDVVDVVGVVEVVEVVEVEELEEPVEPVELEDVVLLVVSVPCAIVVPIKMMARRSSAFLKCRMFEFLW